MLLTNEEIDEIIAEDFNEWIARHSVNGSYFGVPNPIASRRHEAFRLDYIRKTEQRDSGDIIRHDRTDKLASWVRDNIDFVGTVEKIAEAAGCSRSTVYDFLNANRGWFRHGGFKGVYRIVDGDAERDAARSGAHSPATASVPAITTPSAMSVADAAMAAIAGRRVARD